jgi:hypothetical protein
MDRREPSEDVVEVYILQTEVRANFLAPQTHRMYAHWFFSSYDV